ncbi:MAG: sulfotransferase [Pseudotabrizicola sp.]|uniref:sulfotransferase n=1 Tax=Pseudotabrizicola sp. TaxID=2939647 RepID=UPI00271B1ADF|nr:sulfotransferase [Pseudotabrizicola sp.]MDO9637540.1 sulfotransferase [Pseudotabrizicola sp.]
MRFSFFKKPVDPPGPVFLLGVGAQKAATTWLYRYLRDHPDCAMGPIKEQSVFQSYYQPERFRLSEVVKIDRLREHLAASSRAFHKGEAAADPAELLSLLDNLAMNHDIDRYWAAFQKLRAARPQARLLGDITPEYSGLTAENFADIRRRMVAEGYVPRVIFLMRDPIERCFSMLRMADRNATEAGSTVTRPAHERFEAGAKSDWCQMYTRYDRTMTALEAAFAPEEIFYGFYETFLTLDELGRACAFLGIDRAHPNFDRRVNWSPRERDLEPGALQSVRAFYDDTYTACKQRFGADFIAGIWRYS